MWITEIRKYHNGFKRLLVKPYEKGLMVFFYEPSHESITFVHGEGRMKELNFEVELSDVDEMELWLCEVRGDDKVHEYNLVLLKVPQSSTPLPNSVYDNKPKDAT